MSSPRRGPHHPPHEFVSRTESPVPPIIKPPSCSSRLRPLGHELQITPLAKVVEIRTRTGTSNVPITCEGARGVKSNKYVLSSWNSRVVSLPKYLTASSSFLEMAVYLILPHTPVYLQVKSHEFDDVTYMYVIYMNTFVVHRHHSIWSRYFVYTIYTYTACAVPQTALIHPTH
jgi:hypothetical protein